MSTSTLVQELTQANRELDEAERLVANLAAADQRGEKVDEQEWRRRLETLERLLAPEFRITRATGKVDDREGFLAVVKSGDRSYRSHQTSVEEVKALGDTGVLTGLIETDGEYRGKPVGGRFRFTKVFTKDPEGWRCVAWQNTPIIETAPDPGSVRAVYEEVCREHAGITDFRGKLLGLLPLASGAGILLLLSGKDPLPPAKMHYLAPFGFLGALVALGLYFYELRGIQVCKVLREHAKHLELAFLLPAGVEGAFSGRPKALGGYVGAEGAGHIVYLAVIGAWGYVAELGWCAEREAWMCSRPSMGPALFVIAALVTTQLLSRLVPRRTLPRVR